MAAKGVRENRGRKKTKYETNSIQKWIFTSIRENCARAFLCTSTYSRTIFNWYGLVASSHTWNGFSYWREQKKQPEQLQFIQCSVCDIVISIDFVFSHPVVHMYAIHSNMRCLAFVPKYYVYVFLSHSLCVHFSFNLFYFSFCPYNFFLFHFVYSVYRRKVITPHSFNWMESAYSTSVKACECFHEYMRSRQFDQRSEEQ